MSVTKDELQKVRDAVNIINVKAYNQGAFAYRLLGVDINRLLRELDELILRETPKVKAPPVIEKAVAPPPQNIEVRSEPEAENIEVKDAKNEVIQAASVQKRGRKKAE
jgi:hypothetical protein